MDLVNKWLAEYVNDHTRAAYEGDVSAYFAWLGGKDPAAATRADLIAYRNYLQGRLSDSSVVRRMTGVASFYRHLLREGEIEASPYVDIPLPPRPSESTTPWLTKAELTLLLRVSEGRDFVMVALLGVNGLRVSELIEARLEDVQTSGGRKALKIRRKGGKVVFAPLSDRVAAAVEELAEGRRVGPVLPRLNSRGRVYLPVQPMGRSGVAKRLRLIAHKAGLTQNITPHSLRHTAITLALNAGVPLHRVQLGAGHENPKTTMRYWRDRDNIEANPALVVAEEVAA